MAATIDETRPPSVNTSYNSNVAQTVGVHLRAQSDGSVIRLQIVTLVWMLAEFGLSAYAAWSAHSPALLAFSSDSLIELFSATVVLLQFIPGKSLSERKAGHIAAISLFVLAGVVGGTAVTSLALRLHPDASLLGIGVAVAALFGMPILASAKRREARRRGNSALAADAVQSATCAYLALVTLLGLVVNLLFHLPFVDSLAALLCVPLLVKEGKSAWRGDICACC